MFRKSLAALAVCSLAIPAVAQTPIRTERVQFAHGASSKAIKGTIRGEQTVDYVVSARAGQTMTVSLKTSNPSNYFNITAPGADAALFIGSSGGSNHSFEIPSNGDYTVRLYLMRNAARRNEAATYTLTIGVK